MTEGLILAPWSPFRPESWRKRDHLLPIYRAPHNGRICADERIPAKNFHKPLHALGPLQDMTWLLGNTERVVYESLFAQVNQDGCEPIALRDDDCVGIDCASEHQDNQSSMVRDLQFINISSQFM